MNKTWLVQILILKIRCKYCLHELLKKRSSHVNECNEYSSAWVKKAKCVNNSRIILAHVVNENVNQSSSLNRQHISVTSCEKNGLSIVYIQICDDVFGVNGPQYRKIQVIANSQRRTRITLHLTRSRFTQYYVRTEEFPQRCSEPDSPVHTCVCFHESQDLWDVFGSKLL